VGCQQSCVEEEVGRCAFDHERFERSFLFDAFYSPSPFPKQARIVLAETTRPAWRAEPTCKRDGTSAEESVPPPILASKTNNKFLIHFSASSFGFKN
jgi:hypothetical protein